MPRSSSLALKGVQVVHADVVLVAEQQHQDREADRAFRSGHGEDEEHEHLAVHVAQVVGERHEVGVDRQQHQFDAHQQHDQVAAVQEDADDGQREEHRAERQEVAQGEAHALVSAVSATGTNGGATTVGSILMMCRRSRAFTRTASAGSKCLLSLRWRSVSAMAATIATSRMTAAISSGYRYAVYRSLPSSLVLENCSPCAAACATAGIARGSSGRTPPISTAAISSTINAPTPAANGKSYQKPTRNTDTTKTSNNTTNRNSTITAPTYT